MTIEPGSSSGLITSRGEFHAALRAALADAANHGARELWLCDNDFADWPIGERAVVESFAQWAASSRRLTLVARHFDDVARRHARWVEWRRTWSHIVTCRTNTECPTGEFPSVLVALGTETRRGRVVSKVNDLDAYVVAVAGRRITIPATQLQPNNNPTKAKVSDHERTD